MTFVIDIDMNAPLTDDNGNKLYRAKGFNSLVFDDYGLEKLEPYDITSPSKNYNCGCAELAEALKTLFDMSVSDRPSALGSCKVSEILKLNSPEFIIKTVSELTSDFKKGDIVINNSKKGVIKEVFESERVCLVSFSDYETTINFSELLKTGKNCFE